MTLALLGGKPVRRRLLPYGRQDVSAADLRAVERVLRSDFLTTGPMVAAFERAFAAAAGCPRAVAISNGTTALHAAYRLVDLQPGDEIITTPLTFAATASAAIYEGGVPRFADVDGEGMLCPSRLREFIESQYRRRGGAWRHARDGGRLRAVAVVHYTGRVADMRPFAKLAREFGVELIEDAAHATGAVYPGTKRVVGDAPWSRGVTFSFHPVKHITTAEGGMLAVRSEEDARQTREFRSHGIDADPESRARQERPYFYSISRIGNNYRLSDVHCALGLSQLKRLPAFLKSRRRLAAMYDRAFADLDAVIRPALPKAEETHAWHLYVIRLRPGMWSADRDTVVRALRAEGIGVNLHYIPVYRHPAYWRTGRYRLGDTPATEAFYAACMTLPLYSVMTRRDAEDTIDAVNKVAAHYRR